MFTKNYLPNEHGCETYIKKCAIAIYFIEIAPPVLVNISLRLRNNNDQADKHVSQNLTLWHLEATA